MKHKIKINKITICLTILTQMQPYNHTTSQYEFCTNTPKSSNQKTIYIGYSIPIGCFSSTSTCTPNLYNQNTVYIGYSIPIGGFSNTSTFPICTPNLSNQNTTYIGYTILIGYFSSTMYTNKFVLESLMIIRSGALSMSVFSTICMYPSQSKCIVLQQYPS